MIEKIEIYACNCFCSHKLSMEMSETLLYLLKKFKDLIPNFCQHNNNSDQSAEKQR